MQNLDSTMWKKVIEVISRRNLKFILSLFAFSCFVGAAGFFRTGHAGVPENAQTDSFRKNEPIRPLPKSLALDQRKVALGKKLFFDPILSKDGSTSCASCHDLKKGGVDGRKFSVGIGNAEGSINAPTVFNSAFNFKQFWDGRAE